MSQSKHKSSVMGIIFGFGIVIAFFIVVFMVGKDDVIEVSESVVQHSGKAIYEKSCVVCHEAGLLNAPKLGNKTDWENRIIKGEEVLLQNAINGFSSMPPRGGASLNDEKLRLAVQYMLVNVGTSVSKPVVENTPAPVKQAVSQPVTPVKQSVVTVDTNQHSGEQVYNRVCMACHNTGLLNAPKLGDKA
ncbi:MAG: c-type cytochrome, partial [Proteobacteria bacterium]|nr:c-type cytochrome [Pseudomonadota bacterium]